MLNIHFASENCNKWVIQHLLRITQGDGGQDEQAVKEVCVCVGAHACMYACMRAVHGIHLVCCQKDFIVSLVSLFVFNR